MRFTPAVLAAALAAPLTFAQTAPSTQPARPPGQAVEAQAGPSVTVYSTADPAGFDPQQFIAQQRQGYNPQFAWQVPGFGVVKDVREIDLKEGVNTLAFTDVAQFIDPTTVSFTDLTDPDGTKVLQQEFQFDLVSASKLLEKYIGQPVSLRVPLGDGKLEEVRGTLLSANQGQLVVQTADGLRLFQQGQVQPILGKVPGGLVTKPTLQWLLTSRRAGKHRVRTAYQTNGITWRADYNLVLDETDTRADLGAWVTLMNLSGAGYDNAQLKLIAGDVQRVQPEQQRDYSLRAARGAIAGEDAEVGFQEKAFFEYHLYTLPRRTDIAQNTTQQIALFPTAQGAKVEKVLGYYGLPQESRYWVFPEPQVDRNLGNQSNKKVDVYVRFKNSEANKLGMPLPRGKVRVFKLDAPGNAPGRAGEAGGGDGALEFVGEDLIDHTPRDEEVLIKLGQAFDVVGERTQTDFNVNLNGRSLTESIKIELRNHKAEAVKVIVKENLFRWLNWEVAKKTDEFKKIDARTIHFETEVPKDGKKVIEYTVRYSW